MLLNLFVRNFFMLVIVIMQNNFNRFNKKLKFFIVFSSLYDFMLLR